MHESEHDVIIKNTTSKKLVKESLTKNKDGMMSNRQQKQHQLLVQDYALERFEDLLGDNPQCAMDAATNAFEYMGQIQKQLNRAYKDLKKSKKL